MSLSDEQLVQRCRAGDRTAFNELVSRHYRGIYRLTLRMVGNLTDAEDLTQETFVKAYAALAQFNMAQKFTTWLYAIAVHLCIDHARKRRVPTVSWEEENDEGSTISLLDRLPDDAPQPDEVVERADLSMRVRQAMLSLPPKYRAVVLLRHIEGLRIEEIAKTLDMPLGTVKTNLFRARKILEKKLKDVVAAT
ncbi:MAG: sigma-70 family RNA polymerase sigma factor [Abditibacteriales bacterium]|nr:sigma-70 family RNA polymerase sigma factor [Abditibacteriales bacterium]